MPPPPEPVSEIAAGAVDLERWFSLATRASEPQPDDTYTEAAVQLLAAEFAAFALPGIRCIFERSRQLYAVAWRVLHDADAAVLDGQAAPPPLQKLQWPRRPPANVVELQPERLRSARLQEEVGWVRAWREHQRRARNEFQEWADGLFFSLDRDGREQLLDVDGAQVMMAWELPYMERCVQELGIGENCDVLEVGFGCGYSAERIQRARPRSHVIIECADAVLKRLRPWAAKRPNVTVVEGTWQARLPELGVFDCIFFDDYGTPGRSDREMERCPDPRYAAEYAETLEEDHGTHFHGFLAIALRFHARKGTRITGYLQSRIDMLRDDVESRYSDLKVDPPGHCTYFPKDFLSHAIVPLFVKIDPVARPPDADRRNSSPGGSRSRSRSQRRDPAWQ